MKLTATYPLPIFGAHTPHYRYFFNGQEADNEVYGNGAILGYEYRMHDTRIGRFWNVDPLSAKFPWNSPYAFAENSVGVGLKLFRQAEKVRQAKEILGPSPMNMLNRVLLNCEKTILSQEKKTIMLPEIRPAEE